MFTTNTAAKCPPALLASLRATLGIFADLSDAEWPRAADALRTQFYCNGDRICTEGEPADAAFVVCQGEVELSAQGTYLLTRGKHCIVGEQALIEGVPRGATMTARGHVQLIIIPRQTFFELLGPSTFAKNLLKSLSSKLNEATAQRAFRFASEERLFSEFRAHVATPVLNELLARGEDYGRPRLIDGVVLLSDVRNFTARSARITPTQVASEIGRYLDHAVDLIHGHGGLVDKFIGDAILAVWGWPINGGDADVAAAFDCALALVAKASSFSFGGAPIEIGVGLNSGPMFIGNVGSGSKRQFTVLGEAVNLAARFESMCKDLHAPIVVSQAVYHRLDSKARAQLTAHCGHTPKGSTSQTVFTAGLLTQVSGPEETL